MRSKKRIPTREEVDDRKFRNAMEGVQFRARIEHEANEAIICLHCGSFDWKMQPKYIVNWLGNELLATMVCRKCKRKMPFASQIEPDYTEEDEAGLDEFVDQLYNQLETVGVDPFMEEILKSRLRRRIARMDENERIRLLMYLR